MLAECKELILHLDDGVLTITLNRPQKRNAMNATLVRELMNTFTAIEHDRTIRAIVLQGSAGNFCAGGDISGMHQTTDTVEQATKAAWNFNRSFGHLITKANNAPQVVVTLLEGAVLGGGFGLACISDIAIADRAAMFALPETGLGIIPAQIAPFVVQRVGLTQARKLALTGERINGQQASDIGIAHYVTDSKDAMDEILATTLTRIKRCAPQANARTKSLLMKVGQMNLDTLLDEAADEFATTLSSAEGKEGTQAFLEKRRPNWADIKESA